MANMRMAKKSSKPIWRRGTMAFMMDFSTICRPGREKGRAQLSSTHAVQNQAPPLPPHQQPEAQGELPSTTWASLG